MGLESVQVALLLCLAVCCLDCACYCHLRTGCYKCRKAGTFFGKEGVFTLQARAAAYRKALAALPPTGGEQGQVRIAALLRLGAVLTRLENHRCDHLPTVLAHDGANETFGQAWLVQAPQCPKDEYVMGKRILALAGRAAEEDMHTVRELQDVCVTLDQPDALLTAVTLWREQVPSQRTQVNRSNCVRWREIERDIY